MRRAPDLERSAGLSTSTGRGGAGATPGSRAAGGIAVVVLSTGVRPAPGVAAVCGRLAERSRVGRGAGGLGGAAPRGATAPAPEGLGIGPVAVVGVARVAATGGVRTPRSGILAGWSGRRGGSRKDRVRAGGGALKAGALPSQVRRDGESMD